jgi:glycosyltransferase involved in cell wall biosynthesis
VRVVVNAVAARMGGAATHLPNFVDAVGRRHTGDSFLVCVNSGWRLSGLPSNVRLIDAGTLRNRLTHAAWDQWGVGRLAVDAAADVILSLLNFGPVRSPVPHVVLERNPVYYCPFYLEALRGLRAVEVSAMRALTHAVMRTARRVVTPSAAMRDMIRARYPDLPAGKFRVIPHGFSEASFRTRMALPAAAAQHMDGSAGTRLLYVSHAASYKGVDILLEASRLLRDERLLDATTWLTIAREDWPAGYAGFVQFMARHHLEPSVRVLGRIPHAAVRRVYEAADLFVYPSLCESFGFPLVEAMATGLPIVAADLPLNREMCGDAAVYYPARDARALAQEVGRVAGTPALRARLIEAGRARSRQFSWDDNADAVMAVLREAVG